MRYRIDSDSTYCRTVNKYDSNLYFLGVIESAVFVLPCNRWVWALAPEISLFDFSETNVQESGIKPAHPYLRHPPTMYQGSTNDGKR